MPRAPRTATQRARAHAEEERHTPPHAERAALQRTAGGASSAPAAQLPRPELGASDEALLLANQAALELTLASAGDAVGAETPPAWIEELESLSAAEQHESEVRCASLAAAAVLCLLLPLHVVLTLLPLLTLFPPQALLIASDDAAKSQDLGATGGGKLQLRRYQLVTRGGAGLRMRPGDA